MSTDISGADAVCAPLSMTQVSRSLLLIVSSRACKAAPNLGIRKMFPTHCLIFQYKCKGPLRLGVPTSVHNVNISSHHDASSVSDMYVSLALNFTYIHVWASLYWLDPFT